MLLSLRTINESKAFTESACQTLCFNIHEGYVLMITINPHHALHLQTTTINCLVGVDASSNPTPSLDFDIFKVIRPKEPIF